MIRRVLVAPLLALALAFALAGPAAAEMTKSEAGQHYLSAICPGNASLARLARAMFGKKKVIRARDMKGKRLKRTRTALRAVERTHYSGAARLLNPPDAWPTEEIQWAAEDMAYAMFEFSDAAANLSRRKKAGFIDYYVNEFTWASEDVTQMSRIARARLGLPRIGRGC